MHRELLALTAKHMRGEQQKGGSRYQQQAESTMDGLWSKLPDELVERMLAYLPVPDLCRFRRVCKRWNSLICTPEFGSLCVQNASKGTGASLIFKVRANIPRTGHSREIQRWSIFDLNAKMWYNVKYELPKGYDYGCQTMDGGLVCTFVNALTDEQRWTSTIGNYTTTQPLILIISNLLGGTIKVLPNPPLNVNVPDVHLKLVVDNRSHTYKVFFICKADFYLTRDRSMCIYESSTNQWRIVRNPPNSNPAVENTGPVVCSACFQGLLYVLWGGYSDFLAQLYTYNFLKDAWDDTGMQFCQRKFSFNLDLCDLVVSDKRLFLLTQCLVGDRVREYQMSEEPGQFGWPLEIREISLAEKALRTGVRLTPAELYQKFCIEPDMHRCCKYNIQAFGYGRSILLMCQQTGKVIEYNLVTELWETLPPNSVGSLQLPSIPHFSPGRHNVSRFGNLMNGFLRLPNTPW